MKLLSYYNTSTSISDEDKSKLRNISKKYPFFTSAKVLLLDNIWNEKDKKEEIKDLLGLTILAHPNRNYLKQYLTREREVTNKVPESIAVKPATPPVKSSGSTTARLWKQPIKRSSDIFIEEFMENIVKAKKAYDTFNEVVERLESKKITTKKAVAPKKTTTKKAVAPKKTTAKKAVTPKKKTAKKAVAPKKTTTKKAVAPKKTTTKKTVAPKKTATKKVIKKKVIKKKK